MNALQKHMEYFMPFILFSLRLNIYSFFHPLIFSVYYFLIFCLPIYYFILCILFVQVLISRIISLLKICMHILSLLAESYIYAKKNKLKIHYYTSISL